jgi:hypothetical protein
MIDPTVGKVCAFMTGPESTWSQNYWWNEVEPHRDGASPWYDRIAWLGVILVAIAAFVNEVGLCLAVALACLNYGRERFRVARWLKRHDPDRQRGKVCWWFYFAWGLWKITYVACFLTVVLGIVQGATHDSSTSSGKNAAVSPAFVVAGMLAMVGFPLTSLVTTFATIMALRRRVRVWLGPEAGWARQARRWPPHTVLVREPTTNRVKTLLFVCLIALAALAILMMSLFFIGPSERSPEKKMNFGFFLVVFLGSLIGVPFGLLMLWETLQMRIMAPTPEACWSIAVNSGGPELSRGS